MTYAARHELARLLAGEQATSRHSSSMTLPPESLELTVEGIGPIRFPLRAPAAKKLISLAQPAHVGKGTETLLDESVRDTWQIPTGLITLGGDDWDATLARALRELGADLGVHPSARLRPELHSLLIYGQGQFFAPHQDSEKDDAMVATLVVSLPTYHTGGELVVDDGGQAVEYRASDYELTLVAFYADRRHEVRPVRRGYRATLTFNLILDPGEESPQGPAASAAELLHEHFVTPPEYSWRRNGQAPGVLGVLLDHEYSRHGLDSGLFKGADVGHVATLRTATELAGYEYAFAHANVQETHQAYEEGSYGWGRRSYFYDDGEQELDAEDLEIGELVDSFVELTWWNDAQAKGNISLNLHEDEVCAVTPSQALEPYESEYEGYMGNYGNTIERWYHRTVMLIWPRRKGGALRAQATPAWALNGACSALDVGDLEVARERAQALAPVVSQIPASDFATLLEVAAGVDDPDLAQLLLNPFSITSFTPDLAPLIAQLSETYGAPWWTQLLESWDSQHRFSLDTRDPWVEDSLGPLCNELVAHGSPEVAATLLNNCISWFIRTVKNALARNRGRQQSTALGRLGSAAAGLIVAGTHIPAKTRSRSVAEPLIGLGEPALPLFTAALRALPPRQRPAEAKTLALEAHRILTSVLSSPARAPGDWSIPWESPGGKDADRLAEFLHDARTQIFEWPIATPRRREIHQLIDGADLPVEHLTRRIGSPYTLVLKKTSELFDREARLREQQQSDFDWIKSRFLKKKP